MKIQFLLVLALLPVLLPVLLTPAFADHIEVTVLPDIGSGSSTDDCVDVEYGCFIPGTATVDLGGKVIFSNTDSAAHTFSAGSAADGLTGEFDTSMVMAGNSYEWTADVVGEIPYYCMIHPWMSGLLVVNELSSITVTTDELEYYTGDTIFVSGEVDERIEDYLLALTVLNPDGNIIAINQLTVSEDKTFDHNFEASGSLMSEEGIYTIHIQYGDDIVETEFNYYSIIFHGPTIIETDKPEYVYDDVVYVRGIVFALDPTAELIISVINPSSNIAYTDIITINEDLTFEMDFDIEGALFDEIGTYTIQYVYGGESTSITFKVVYPDMTNEELYLEILNIYDILATLTNSTNVNITDVQTKINKLADIINKNVDVNCETLICR